MWTKTSMHVLAVMVVLFVAGPSPADEAKAIDCLQCHNDLISGMTTHMAVNMDCQFCHVGIDATEVPHRITNSRKRGLLSDTTQLCFSCHDRKEYSQKFKHAALDMGCTVCHDPHASRNPRLLKATVPTLCFTCHDRGPFSRKIVHGPVSAGLCLQCHVPHSSKHDALLHAVPARTCGFCHAPVLTTPHLVNGMGGKSHPVGGGRDRGEKKQIKDPARPGKRFSCTSCHDPHSADMPRMVRFAMQTSMDICRNCHTAR